MGPTFFMFLLIFAQAIAGTPKAVVEIKSEKAEIFPGEVFYIDLHLKNVGSERLKPVGSSFCQFERQWLLDNSVFVYNRGMTGSSCPEIFQSDGSILPNDYHYTALKPGQSKNDKMDLYIPRDYSGPSKLKLRMGYKEHASKETIWSNQVTIQVKKDEEFKVRFELSSLPKTLKADATAKISARVFNESDKPINIGREICGIHGLIDWISDNPHVFVFGGSGGCAMNIAPDQDIVLKPKESYRQEITISFDSKEPPVGMVTFRLGLQNVGHLPAWANPMHVTALPR